MIPPVEATTPLAVDVTAPPAETTETTEAAVPEAVTEVKKDVKEKRKSSLPFAFGKRDKSPAPAEGEEKSKNGPFSKLRATIKGKTSKSEEKPAEEKAAEEPIKEEAATEEAKPAEETPKTEETKAEEVKPENVAATTTPAVTAAA